MRAEHDYFDPPSSRDIVSAIIRALRPDHEHLKGSTAGRYRRGEPVTEYTEEQLFGALAEALAQAGIFPSPPDGKGLHPQAREFLTDAIRWHCQRWDQLVGWQQGWKVPVGAGDIMALAYLRLAVVDLAFRTAAVCWLGSSSLPDEQPPLWAGGNTRGIYLQKLMERIDRSRLTRKRRKEGASLAEQVGVSNQTMDNWLYQGVRSSNHNIDKIAKVLAKYLKDSGAQTVAAALRRHYTLCQLADLLAEVVGRAQVEDLASALIRLASRLLSRLAAYDPRADREMMACQMMIATGGITDPLPTPDAWLAWLRDQEEDAGWQGDITTAGQKDWALWLNDLAAEICTAAQLTQRGEQRGSAADNPKQRLKLLAERRRMLAGRVPESPSPWMVDPDDLSGQAAYYYHRSRERRQAADMEHAEALMREAIKSDPQQALYHVGLAELLGESDRVDEAIVECRIAGKLDLDPEPTQVVIGTLLNNAERFEEARDHLEAMPAQPTRSPARLIFSLELARARLGCGEPAQALPRIETVLAEQPDQGFALDLAARCHFLLGDHTRGWDRAKQARRRGHTATFVAAGAGVFRKSGPGPQTLAG